MECSFPKFFHPDPSVERRSGLLQPKLNKSNVVGSSITIPYYKVISENKDLTFKPTIFDSNIQMYQSEYRQENLNSSFIADFNYVKGYKSKSLNKKNSIKQLEDFCGNKVIFYTGLAIVSNPENTFHTSYTKTTIHYRNFSKAEMLHALKVEKAYDCVGASKIEAFTLSKVLPKSVQLPKSINCFA